MSNIYIKYIKYKNKYLNLKNQISNDNIINENLNYFLNFNTISELIHNKYENFNNKVLINKPITRLGQPSANGFIHRINYKNNKDNQTFDTILKTSKQKTADNNYYEFFVGMCINKIKQFYPNFIYSYAYIHLYSDLKNELEQTAVYDNISNFQNKTYVYTNLGDQIYNMNNVSIGCFYNDRASILIENVPNSLSFDKLINDNDFKNDINYNIFCVLFQLYVVLAGLRNIYTHYDLHTGNVMYVKLPNKIKIIYTVYNNEKIIIYTQFIPVIIDYGRSFIDCSKLNSNVISSVFTELACQNSHCNSETHPNCILNRIGMSVNRDNTSTFSNQDNFYYINLRKSNVSADLRFIMIFIDSISKIMSIDIINKLSILLNNVNNPEWFLPNSLNYNVSEQNDKFLSNNKIKTTTDIFYWLLIYYKNNYTNLIFNNLYGTMTINQNINENIKWSFHH